MKRQQESQCTSGKRSHLGNRVITFLLCLSLFPLLLAIQSAAAQHDAGTFHNPLLSTGPDPWVTTANGFYYYMNTTQRDLVIRRTRDITDLAHAEVKTVWTAPKTGPYSQDIWAPELHHLGGKWYIYFAADDGHNETHRIYVIENPAVDPLDGSWTFRGKVSDPTDRWAIDASVFEVRGKTYMVWSGWEGATDGEQRIYIAGMNNPWTINTGRTAISIPTYSWERVGDLPDRPAVPHVNVNEGPEILVHGKNVFLVYSGSACWTDYYELGIVYAEIGSDLLKSSSWTKLDHPFFQQDREHHVFGPGHNGFFQSLDGKEDWIIYHANEAANQGCGNHRSPRIQQFKWNPDGTPDVGRPESTDTELEKPSGSSASPAARP